MTEFFHPSRDTLSLTAILNALGDPVRLKIVNGLAACLEGLNCSQAAHPFPDIPKSTLSNHFRILRESGLITTSKRGVENLNILRREDLEARFPGLLESILRQMN